MAALSQKKLRKALKDFSQLQELIQGDAGVGMQVVLGINPGSTATLATLKPFSIIFKHFQELSWLSHKLSRRRDQ